jgi:hypothetical protein
MAGKGQRTPSHDEIIVAFWLFTTTRTTVSLAFYVSLISTFHNCVLTTNEQLPQETEGEVE